MVNTLDDPLTPSLDALTPDAQLQLLKRLKHEIIGHLERKQQVLASGILPPLVAVLRTRHPADASVQAQARVQAAIVLASLCQAPGLVAQSTPVQDSPLQPGQLDQSTLTALMGALLEATVEVPGEPSLAIPCLRALGQLCAAGAPTEQIWSPMILDAFHRLLLAHEHAIKPTTLQQAMLISNLLATHRRNVPLDQRWRRLLLDALIAWIFNMIRDGGLSIETASLPCKCLEQLLRAAAALCENNVDACIQFAGSGGHNQKLEDGDRPMLTLLLTLVKSESDGLRLYASSCLAQILQQGALPRKLYPAMQRVVVPILVRLLDVTSMADKAPFVLAQLVNDSADLQQAAVEAGALTALVGMFKTTPTDAARLEGNLLALAALTLSKDEYRRQALDAHIVATLLQAMQHKVPAVRAAACQCTRSISRSMAILRTNLLDASLASVVFSLLDDTDLQVRTTATAAVCNLVLEFSHMRTFFLSAGILDKLVPFCTAQEAELRLNAVWALKHLVYAADAEIKVATLTALSPQRLCSLCDDSEPAVSEQAMELLRNLICGKPEMIDGLLQLFPAPLLMTLINKNLQPQVPSQVAASALYTLVHLAAGSVSHKDLVLSDLACLKLVVRHLNHTDERCRVPAVWIFINLTWSEDHDFSEARTRRINQLVELDVLTALRSLEEDPSQDVRERVKTALLQLQS
ncbi:armadillo-type protein [Protomyces lactucae-debilis]|uniref:Armadillo-type protein n=1 Tax=Protomyces lactucae-debilis TaxID=2754530 RepID=A0A1Y2FJV0_PROLT|nr:armadillo-type protein [Protomyces lactucae-debilis]ORY84228.1 armadillo-type protein [Protomyces lactucae-debilis]